MSAGSTTERDYGTDHQRERRRLQFEVDAGRAWCQQGIPGNGSSGRCVMPSRWIAPGSKWALGHRDDRRGRIGTCHAKCNQLDGASRGGKVVAAKKKRRGNGTWHSRIW